VPKAFTAGTVLTSRVENVAGQLLNRVWIDEYQWDTSNPSAPAKRVQSLHLPARTETVSTASGSPFAGADKSRLTLPYTQSRTLGLGQLTNTNDRCAVSIGGFDVGVGDVNSTTLFPSDRVVIALNLDGSATTPVTTPVIKTATPHGLSVGSAFYFASLGLPAAVAETSTSPAVVAGAARGPGAIDFKANMLYYVCQATDTTLIASDAANMCKQTPGSSFTTTNVAVSSVTTTTTDLTFSSATTPSISDTYRVGDMFYFSTVGSTTNVFTNTPYFVCSMVAGTSQVSMTFSTSFKSGPSSYASGTASGTCGTLSTITFSGQASAVPPVIVKMAYLTIATTTLTAQPTIVAAPGFATLPGTRAGSPEAVLPSTVSLKALALTVALPKVLTTASAHGLVAGNTFYFNLFGSVTGSDINALTGVPALSLTAVYLVCAVPTPTTFYFARLTADTSSSAVVCVNSQPTLTFTTTSSTQPMIVVTQSAPLPSSVSAALALDSAGLPVPSTTLPTTLSPTVTFATTDVGAASTTFVAAAQGLSAGRAFYFTSIGAGTTAFAESTTPVSAYKYYYVCSFDPSTRSLSFSSTYNFRTNGCGTTVSYTGSFTTQPIIALPVPLITYTSSFTTTSAGTTFTTASAHGLLVGGAFYFTSVVSDRFYETSSVLSIAVTSYKIYFVCSTPSPLSFSFATSASCDSLATLTGTFTSPPVIAVPAYYSASKNSNAFVSQSAGSGFLASQAGGFKGYRLSIARISNSGWNTASFDHWLPKNKWYASDVYMSSWNDVPRAVAMTGPSATIHANQVFYATGYNANTVSVASDYNDKSSFAVTSERVLGGYRNGAGGSVRGRCFKGVADYVNSGHDKSGSNYPVVGMKTADTFYNIDGLGVTFSGTTSSNLQISGEYLSSTTSQSCPLLGSTNAFDIAVLSSSSLALALGASTTASSTWTTAVAHNLVAGSKFQFDNTAKGSFVTIGRPVTFASTVSSSSSSSSISYTWTFTVTGTGTPPAAWSSTKTVTIAGYDGVDGAYAATCPSPGTIVISSRTSNPIVPVTATLTVKISDVDITYNAVNSAPLEAINRDYFVCSVPTATTFSFSAAANCESLLTFSASSVTTQPRIVPYYLRAADSTAGCMSPYYAFKYSNGYKCGTSPTVGCQCFSSDFVTLDPGNTDGTSGFCFVGPASNADLHLLQVRSKSSGGSIFDWPITQSTNTDNGAYSPSLVTTEYEEGSYKMSPLSSSSTVGAANTGVGSNLRNCAGKTPPLATSTDLQTTGASVVWAEFGAPNGYAVQRSDNTGSYGVNIPIWGQGATANTLPGFTLPGPVDNAIVGVTFYQYDNSPTSLAKQDVLYASSTIALYASLNAFASTGSATWYIIAAIGKGESMPLGTVGGQAVYGSTYLDSEYRGVAYAPKACSSTYATLRALAAEAEEAEAEEAEAVSA